MLSHMLCQIHILLHMWFCSAFATLITLWSHFVTSPLFNFLCPQMCSPLRFSIAVGGELLPHRPDGSLLVYSITMQGVVYFRKGVERACPEGTAWVKIDLPVENSIINCSVGPMGSLWLISEDGSVLVRQGVTWKNVLGECVLL